MYQPFKIGIFSPFDFGEMRVWGDFVAVAIWEVVVARNFRKSTGFMYLL